MTDTDLFDYHLPEELIAQTPAEPRDSSRLLDTRDLSDHVFTDLAALLAPDDLVVVNRTRVRPARLAGHKTGTGGSVEALLLRRRGVDVWEALVRPARRIKAGTVVEFGYLVAEVLTDPVEGIVRLRLSGGGDVEEDLAEVGEVPIPPYITAGLADPGRYQTMFAEVPGSAAAPTAGLHFTPAVVAALGARGIHVAKVDLEVGMATFRPIATATIEDHLIHRELCRIDPRTAEAVRACRRRRGRVVAVGTTVVRTLETFARGDGTVGAGSVDTDLYLRPGMAITVVDLLVTNFHLPRSSLLVLIEAFMGPGWRQVYDTAISRRYRFLSFGDAMLAERAR